MRRLKKNVFYSLWGGLFVVLAVVRYCMPQVVRPHTEGESFIPEEAELEPVGEELSTVEELSSVEDLPIVEEEPEQTTVQVTRSTESTRMPDGKDRNFHPIRGVYSYNKCFPDLQEVQIVAAKRNGVKPVRNRQAAEDRKSELVYVAANPYFCIDKRMTSSVPYLVPKASDLLQTIGRNFLDSLYVKGVPLHRIIVSSVLRTEEDVERLTKRNGNASDQSCHRFGTTFDIAYNRYVTVSNPDGPQRREVKNDTLKWVLSEVLRDVREQGRCYVKHEVKQGCFHITVR